MVKINGEDKEIAGRNLLEYLNEAGFETERVVVEKNLEIIPKDQFGQVVIQNEDVIEVCRWRLRDDKDAEGNAGADLQGTAGSGI